MSVSRALKFVWLAAVLLLVAQPAPATTLIPIDLEGLSNLSDAVIVGTAVHQEIVPSKDGSFPFTFVTFDVERVFKGTVRGRHLTLRLQGGTLDDETVVIHGMPRFDTGERYLLFVYGNGVTASPVLGWIQGQYRFVREPRSGREVLVDWRGAPLRGIAEGRWLRGRPEEMDPSSISAAPGVTLLSQEGVIVTPAGVEPGPPENLPEAKTVLQSLETFLRQRTGRPEFSPGRKIESADPADVPVRVGGSLIPPAK